MASFKHVGLVAKIESEQVRESLRRVEQFLLSRSVEIMLETETARLVVSPNGKVGTLADLGTQCDLVIALGGDGNILKAARALAPFGVPILGINLGRLGFLADVSQDEIELHLGAVLSGDYSLEEHFLLEGEVADEVAGEVAGNAKQPSALNEVLVHSANMPKMIEMDIYVDELFVYTQLSDGLIMSSPTGSTAYALSAGGPIMHPSLDAIVLVSMFPHSLTSRPLVIPGDSEIKVVIAANTDVAAQVSFDSHLTFKMEPGHSLLVRKKKERLKLVHPPGHSFYGACRSKLDWGSKPIR